MLAILLHTTGNIEVSKHDHGHGDKSIRCYNNDVIYPNRPTQSTNTEPEGDILQHGQERRRLHVRDPDLVLILGQFSVEHGVEHGAADGQDVLTEQRNNMDAMRDEISTDNRSKPVIM